MGHMISACIGQIDAPSVSRVRLLLALKPKLQLPSQNVANPIVGYNLQLRIQRVLDLCEWNENVVRQSADHRPTIGTSMTIQHGNSSERPPFI